MKKAVAATITFLVCAMQILCSCTRDEIDSRPSLKSATIYKLVYYTGEGTEYHSEQNCSALLGAEKIVPDEIMDLPAHITAPCALCWSDISSAPVLDRPTVTSIAATRTTPGSHTERLTTIATTKSKVTTVAPTIAEKTTPTTLTPILTLPTTSTSTSSEKPKLTPEIEAEIRAYIYTLRDESKTKAASGYLKTIESYNKVLDEIALDRMIKETQVDNQYANMGQTNSGAHQSALNAARNYRSADYQKYTDLIKQEQKAMADHLKALDDAAEGLIQKRIDEWYTR